MRIRLRAEVEPYTSYAKEGNPQGFLSFCDGPCDIEVLPAKAFLALPDELKRALPRFAYGPAALLAPCFAAGCLDYLREPWSMAELSARAGRFERLSFGLGPATFELRDRLLKRIVSGTDKGSSIELSQEESLLCGLLIRNAGKTVPRQALANCLEAIGPTERSLNRKVVGLRRKLSCLDALLGPRLRVKRDRGYLLEVSNCD